MASPQMPKLSKRPRLALQINTACNASSRGFRGQQQQAVDPSDPTSFNTMSNIYMTAMERFSALPSEPITAINTLQHFGQQTHAEKVPSPSSRIGTPFSSSSSSSSSSSTCPATPLTARPLSPQQKADFLYPGATTATPPLSAGALDNAASKLFRYSLGDPSSSSSSPPRPPRACRSMPSPAAGDCASAPRRRRPSLPFSEPPGRMPYTHPRSLHSILRNSPLPASPAAPPPSPRRRSVHHHPRQQKASAKKVGYGSPLEEEIKTFTYTRSHIDLLAEDGSPLSPSGPGFILDVALSFTPNEIQDGGQTPGPLEDTIRKMAGLAASSSPDACANRKRKRLEKKRQWVWTIGQEGDDDDLGGAITTALRTQTTCRTMQTPRHQSSSSSSSSAGEARCEDVETRNAKSPRPLAEVWSEVGMPDTPSPGSPEDHQSPRLSVFSGAEAEDETPTGF